MKWINYTHAIDRSIKWLNFLFFHPFKVYRRYLKSGNEFINKSFGSIFETFHSAFEYCQSLNGLRHSDQFHSTFVTLYSDWVCWTKSINQNLTLTFSSILAVYFSILLSYLLSICGIVRSKLSVCKNFQQLVLKMFAEAAIANNIYDICSNGSVCSMLSHK